MRFLRLAFLFIALTALLPSKALAQTVRTDAYSSDTVWDWSSHFEDLPPLCGVTSWFELRPDDRVSDVGCIEAAMRQLGASESAVRFFETTSQFLNTFDERGAIDFGHASSPWFNMGRGESVLLNGAPSAILMSRALNLGDDSWKSQPGYAELVQRYPNAFPWVEYGGPQSERASDDGGAVVAISFDMRECRACANLATFRVELHFDPNGFISSLNTLPPNPPRSY
jgi:hypothetical protein